ncbi:hypothetical protein [Tahibacter caeni]|uniref:hypothetical protein n=1 Tax=Tahibacter caeni TaxID=1453545 RepID=UPI002147B012|nr:hypothetical protein [Tahibacter caeni]
MAAFVTALPVALRHPYPDPATTWDGARGVLTAPTVVDGLYDQGRIDLRYRGATRSGNVAGRLLLKARPFRPTGGRSPRRMPS